MVLMRWRKCGAAHVQYEDDDDDGDIKGPATHAVKIVGVVVGAGRVSGHAFFCL